MGAGCSRRALPSTVPGVAAVRSEANSAWQSQNGGSKAAVIEGAAKTTKHPASTKTMTAASNGSGAPRVAEEEEDPFSTFEEVADELRKVEQAKEEASQKATDCLTKIFGPDVRIVKCASINDHLVFVVDGLVSEEVRDSLFECLQKDAFRRTEFARPDTQDFRHHVVEYSPDRLRRTELYAVVARLVSLLFPQEQLEAYRIYTNAIMYGDAAFMHRDANDTDHVTALVYPNPDWSSEMGGETVFYDERGEAIVAVEPRAGRVCVFHGCIQHKGSPPSRLFWGSRYTTAFKFAPVTHDAYRNDGEFGPQNGD